MAKWYGQSIGPDDASDTDPTRYLVGGEPMTGTHARAVHRLQDTVVARSRRVVWRSGLRGSGEWLAPNGPHSSGSTQDLPLHTADRVIGHGNIYLTPGCYLEAHVLYIPSGATDQLDGSDYIFAGAQGRVTINCTWTSSTSDTTTHSVSLAGSQIQDSNSEQGDEPTTAAALWSAVRNARIFGIEPPDLDQRSDRHAYSAGTNVSFTVTHTGSPRIVDMVICEVPKTILFEADDATWTSHVARIGEIGNSSTPEFPVDEIDDAGSDGDPRGGTLHTISVHEAQRERFGPSLITWHAYTEEDTDVDDATAVPWTTASTSNVGIPDTSLTAYDEDAPGWCVGTGGYARDWKHNGAHVLRGRIAVVPVMFRVYAGSTGSGTVRIQTGPYSYVERTGITTVGWYTAFGYLQVGVTPDQKVVAQAFGRDASGTLSVWAIQVYRTRFAV